MNKFTDGLRLLPHESELPLCLQESFWSEFAEEFGEARRLGFEVVTLMDEVTDAKKTGKSIPNDFNQRREKAVKDFQTACEKLQEKHLVIWREANKK